MNNSDKKTKETDYQKVGSINGSLIHLNNEIKALKDKIKSLEKIGDQLFDVKKTIYNKYGWTDYGLMVDSFHVLGEWMYESKTPNR